MNTIRKEIRDLITINEKIQSALLNGDRITDDEVVLIRQCASELLEKIKGPSEHRNGQPVERLHVHEGGTREGNEGHSRR